MTIETEDMGNRWFFFKDSSLLGKYSAREVNHHIRLCEMVELVGEVKAIYGKYLDVGGLSESGQKFLGNISDEQIWARLLEMERRLPRIGAR